MASGKGSDIYGANPTDLADKVSSEAMSQLSDAGRKVDVNGVSDKRVKTPNMGKGRGSDSD